MSKEAVSGMNGITMQKQEGDKKTPAGVYRFTMAFGLEGKSGNDSAVSPDCGRRLLCG